MEKVIDPWTWQDPLGYVQANALGGARFSARGKRRWMRREGRCTKGTCTASLPKR